MTVTKIEEADTKRVKVTIDGQFSFPLYKGELRTYRIEEGKELLPETGEELLTKVLPKRASLRCMNLLKTKSYTERQLRDKLRQGFYPEELADKAIAYVKSYGYVDDGRYAEDFIAFHSQEKSRRRIEQDLMKKGIDREIIKEAFEKAAQEGGLPDETAMAGRLLSRKNYDPQTASLKEKQKLSTWLYGKGFGSDAIRNALLLDITPN